jgi:hypothetical protein
MMVTLATSAGLLVGCTDGAPASDPATTPPPASGSPPPSGPATGKVTLNWARPTSNEDGSTLTDLAGYKVYYGTAPYALATSLDVHGGTVTSVEIQGLAHGSWYFAIASYNADGVESSKSGVVTTTI